MPTHTPTLEATATIMENSDEETPGTPTSTDIAKTDPTNEDKSNTSCLTGTWIVDHASMLGYLKDQANIPDQFVVVFQTGSGDMYLDFDDTGNTSIEVDSLVISITIVGYADFTFLIIGGGKATYAANETHIATWDHEDNIKTEGSGEIEGQPTSIDAVLIVTPEQLYLESTADNIAMIVAGAPDTARITAYTCSSNSLALDPLGSQSTFWSRLVE